MSSIWGKFKKIFSNDSPPKRENEGSPVDFDKYYEPEIIGTSAILSYEDIIFIDKKLPQRMVGVKWILKYSTNNDGYSLSTLYRKLREWDHPVLLVIRDDCGFRFGAFANESFRPDYKVRGTYECFVFRLKHETFLQVQGRNRKAQSQPKTDASRDSSRNSYSSAASLMEMKELSGSSTDQELDNAGQKNTSNGDKPEPRGGEAFKDSGASSSAVSDTSEAETNGEHDYSESKVWGWSRQIHNVFIHGELDILKIGVNDGQYALWVDGDLKMGGSDPCKTFDNEQLAPNPFQDATNHTFNIIDLEVWGFSQTV